MPNPNNSTARNFDDLNANIHDASEKLRDSGERFMNNARSRAREIVEDVSDRASGIYDQAGEWAEDNRVLSYVALGAACGLIGYLIGNRMSGRSFGESLSDALDTQ